LVKINSTLAIELSSASFAIRNIQIKTARKEEYEMIMNGVSFTTSSFEDRISLYGCSLTNSKPALGTCGRYTLVQKNNMNTIKYNLPTSIVLPPHDYAYIRFRLYIKGTFGAGQFISVILEDSSEIYRLS
jgi:hypothetical protein